MTIEMYNKAFEKKPAGKFNDLITALKKSGWTDLTEPLLKEMMPKSNHLDVIDPPGAGKLPRRSSSWHGEHTVRGSGGRRSL